MNRVIAVVEGKTEQAFVREVLAPWLGSRGVSLFARLVGDPGHKGGVGEYPRAKSNILRLLKQNSESFVTMMFDYYGMPNSWPGRKNATKATYARKAATIEQAILKDITHTLGAKLNKQRFLPYVQMHEFEGLLFSRPRVIAEVVNEDSIADALQAIRDRFRSPEEINDGPETAPSKCIQKFSVTFDKPVDGVFAAQRIGIETIRQECPHFNQ